MMPDYFIVRESRQQAALRLLGCMALIGITVWAVSTHGLKAEMDDKTFRNDVILALCATFFVAISTRYVWTLFMPGHLTISPAGIGQDLGWRKREWSWSELAEARLVTTVGGFVTVCIIQPWDEGPVRLFGWKESPTEILRMIEHFSHQTSRPNAVK